MPSEQKPLIMVLDDSEQGRYVTVRVLRSAGFRTIEAANGKDAIALADREKPDIAILDIRLPDIDGFEVCRRLRENTKLPSLAIVQRSATFEGAEYQVRALEGGADTFLSDPVDPTVLVATMRAMLRLRRAESQLREFDRRKDEFLATVAHELRNPLAPLRNCLELLEHATDSKKVLSMCLPIMTRQTDHLVRLVDDLADMSRITQNKLTLRLAATDLLQSLHSAVEERCAELDAKGQTLTLEVPQHPVMLTADSVRLSQVFGNLLTNSVRYTPAGGRIDITVQQSADAATVIFTDNGAGIDPPDLDRIFDLFVQVAPHNSGLGIGLALVQRIVQMHGGSITAASEGRGKGSTFTVRLPLALAAPAIASDDRRGGVQFRASLEAKSGGGAGSPQRVLIVDDNVDAADSLAGLLKSQGHEVRVVYRGEDGLDEYAVFAPNVIFMDINMPGMDGLQAIAKIRATAQGPRPLICTLSGHGKTYASRAFEAGADTHLVKPVSSEDLGSVFARA
jgi:signal transduction histidine kinase